MNREEWLTSCLDLLREVFDNAGTPLPENVRVTCGFPSKSAVSRKRKRIGECWDSSVSEAQVFEIFISPVLSDALEVAAVVAHEAVHAAVGLAVQHGPKFSKLAYAIGLTGKPTSTVAGPAFIEWFNAAQERLGAYPHARLNATSGPAKQTTRLLKLVCLDCQDEGEQYIVRISSGTLTRVGAPLCPCHECALTLDQ